jgi:hypothetical protein
VITNIETMDEYHRNAAIGSGDIRDFIRSPQLYRDRQDGVIPDKDTPAMRLGTLTHMAFLEPERYASSVVTKPEGMSFATKEGKAWRDAHEGKEIVTEMESANIHHMRNRMPDEVRTMLASGLSEVTVRNKLAGFDVQCRADHWDRPGNMVYDLKTISAIEKVEGQIYKMGYHIQAQWYRRVIEAETGKIPTMRLIFAETAPPYRWRVVQLDVDYQLLADQQIDDALEGIASRTKSGDWSDPEDLHLVASPPSWLNDDDTENEEE